LVRKGPDDNDKRGFGKFTRTAFRGKLEATRDRGYSDKMRNNYKLDRLDDPSLYAEVVECSGRVWPQVALDLRESYT
jgi:hypothetical protein